MALRAVWIIPLPGNGPASVLFSRTYPTVERRAKIVGTCSKRNDYVKIPNEQHLYKAVFEELGLIHASDKFILSRDCCDKKFQKPIFEIATNEGKLWPVIIIEKFGILYSCMPLVENVTASRPPLIDIPGISMGFSLLFQLSEVLGLLPRNVSETHPKLQELYSYLCQAAPFGTVVDSNPTTVRAASDGQTTTQAISPHTKQPAWRPVVPKTKPLLHFAITEQIRAVLYNRDDVDDVYQLYGILTCKAELDGVMPEVTMNLTVPPDAPPLENLIIHPCVAAADALNIQPGELTSRVRKFHFNPPTEMFILCHYTATAPSGDQPNQNTPPSSSRRPSSTATRARSTTPTSISRSSIRDPVLDSPTKRTLTGGVGTSLYERSYSPTPSQLSFQALSTPTEMPIKAAFEMTGNEHEVQLKFRLRLNGLVKNNFEYFEVQIPFFNRGSVSAVDVNPSIGSVVLAQDRHRLGWNLGQKLPSRTLEATLKASVQFDARTPKDENRDSFCVGLNTYALIYFKVSDYTHSGCLVEARSVQVQPSSKVRVTAVREFLSSEYKVWNSLGDVMSCLPPFQQEM